MTIDAIYLLRLFIWVKLVPRAKSRALTNEYLRGYFKACEDITKQLEKVQA